MDTDDAADLLNELDDAKADAIISNIDDIETQEEIQELLEHDEDTAGGLMTTEIFEISSHLSKVEILNQIQERHQEVVSFYDIYVVDEHRKLVGTINLQELIIAGNSTLAKDIMNNTDIKSINAEMHWKDVAEFMNKYNLITVPVISHEHELLGMVSVDDILDRLLS